MKLNRLLSINLFVFILLGGIFIQKSQAFTVRHLPLESLVYFSYDIVQGKVISSEKTIDENGMSVTYVTLKVNDIVKGQPAVNHDQTMVFKQANISGIPQYTDGKDYIFFLYGESERYGLRSPVGATQGLVKLSKDENGQLVIKGKSQAKSKLKALIQGDSKFSTLAANINTSGDIQYQDFKAVISNIDKQQSSN